MDVQKVHIHLPECDSTNTWLQQHSRSYAEGAVVSTDFQTQGKGQRGKVWQSARGVNLMFSYLLKHTFSVAENFYLTCAVSLAVRDYLSAKQPSFFIKWPNDLYYQEKKIGGMLIENQIQGSHTIQSIIGIGLNINQQKMDFPQAISLYEVDGKIRNIADELNVLLGHLHQRLQQFKKGEGKFLKTEYETHLLGKNEERTFQHNETTFVGRIIGVTDNGFILIESEGKTRNFSFGEIKFLFV